jgi:DNA/RNA-binding domain of Phe-tRNA-synthetase-like protein
MDFIVDEAIWRMFAGLRLVVAVGDQLDNQARQPAVEEELKRVQYHLRENWKYPNPQSHPSIAAWREAFRTMGVSGKQFPSSIEALVRRVLSAKPLAPINPLVDFYNSVSLKYLAPAGGWDLEDISGSNLWLKITRGGEAFTELGTTDPVHVNAGEVSYMGDVEVLTRHFVWRQAETGKIQPKTTYFFLVSEILSAVGPDIASAVERAVREGMRKYFAVQARTAILDSTVSHWTLD